MIELAHSFGAVSVAKSVEATEDLVELYKMNCDMAQGHLLARAMPINQLVQFLRVKAQRQRQLAANGPMPARAAFQIEEHPAETADELCDGSQR